MGFLKGFAAGVISLVLFVALSVFGMVFMLNQTVLNPSLLITEVNRLDLPSLADQLITQQVGQIPGQQALQKTIIKNTVTDLQPWMKQEAASVITVGEAYFKGNTSTLSIVVPLDTVKKSLVDNTNKAILASPPPELRGVPPAQVTAYINQSADQLTAPIPATLTIDEKSMSAGDLATVRQIRQYTSKIMLIMVGLILLMLLLIGLLFLVNRNVKQTSRDVGVTFLMSGVITYALAFFGNKFSPNLLNQMGGIPDALRAWLPQVIQEWTQPVLTFGLVVAIIGVLLIIFSFIYKRKSKPSVA